MQFTATAFYMELIGLAIELSSNISNFVNKLLSGFF